MSLPEPEVPLDHICSVVWKNTLYTYSSGAFQALELKHGAKWKRLEIGQPVDGAVCVGVALSDSERASLWVVGGQTSTDDYSGLQRYTFSTKKWETIDAQEPVARNRRWHGATYLPSTDQIVTYAGNTDGVQHISTSTFTIRASHPWDVQAYESVAPPTTNPMLLRWSDSQAVMLGGDGGNTKVMLFRPDTSWTDLGVTLPHPPKDIAVSKSIVVDGDDGSKHLLLFDLSEIPNRVERVVLQGAGGAPVDAPAVASDVVDGPVRRGLTPTSVLRRDLTVDSWPAYNDTLAPDVTRVNFALAEGSDGLIVLAGGNPDSPISLFDVRENTWQNATLALAAEQEVLTDESSTASSATATSSSSSSSSSSATSATSTSPSSVSSAGVASTASSQRSLASASSEPTESSEAVAAGASGGGGLDGNAILGIVLGSIVLVMIILGLALLCIRRKKNRRRNIEAGHVARAASVARSDEKVESEFAKELAMDAAPPYTPGRTFRKQHQPSDSAASYSSMAILMGQMNQQKPGKAQERGHTAKRSSTSSSFHKGFKGTISHPMPQVADHLGLQNGARPPTRDEKNAAPVASPSSQPRPPPPPGAPRGDGTRRSSGWNRYWSGGSALNLLGFGAQKRMTTDSDSSHYSNRHRITQDSATVPPLNFEGRPQMNRVMSGSPTVAYHPNAGRLNEEMSGKIERPVSAASSGYSSGVPESIRETWDPLTDKKPWGTERAPSSAYSETFYHPTSLAPSTRQTGTTAAPGVSDGVSKQPQLAMASTSSDMSWLNLGDLQKGTGSGFNSDEPPRI